MERIVNAKTGLYAILGDPIEHSMSPVIMNKAFLRNGMDRVLVAMRCNTENVDCVMKALRSIDLKGYVVTMPLKERMSGYLDGLRDEAAITGAVNCICNENGKLIGYNTDSIGFWNAVMEKNTARKAIRKVFVLGMGGLAKAVVAQTALQGVTDIVATNHMEEERFVKSFRDFLDRLKIKIPEATVRMIPWDLAAWRNELERSDLIVNATSNGMNNHGDLEQQFPYEAVEPDSIFFDAIYSPLRTRFLESAQQKGHVIVEGLNLLVHQGVCAFQIWTGKDADPSVMYQDAFNFILHG
ncbi:shikimate dehydrogenase [Caproiciproducens sp. NJN-50]|uniref:shikimate dehydrogenase family protein n=1 Tax=Caproiciproducens sp. NJN-50 TaxID=2507162 RepID=UPI000FFE1101|nr:shikimate dehydrogenase [Caproiciproducens sp. NJN-50]QAT48782.1 shikimate dehydrogenase [Caproiciproducens sp. NJN-50]